MAARGSRKRASAIAPLSDSFPLPRAAAEPPPAAERIEPTPGAPPSGRAGFIRCRVLQRVSAHGYVVEGFARAAWEPGDVGDFRPHIIDGLPEHLERI